MISHRRVTGVGLALVGLLLVAGLAGYATLLPAEHTASASTEVAATVDDVFALVSDPARLSEIRPPADVGTLEIQSTETPWVVRMGRTDDTDLVAVWTWSFTPTDADGTTRVTVVEDGEIHDPVQRLTHSLSSSKVDAIQLHLTALRDHFHPPGDLP